MNKFDNLYLPKAVKKTLREIKFYSPTPIQSEAIPHVLMGKDLLASAQTGTGKTAAFGIPVIHQVIIKYNKSNICRNQKHEWEMKFYMQNCHRVNRWKQKLHPPFDGAGQAFQL